MDTVTPYRFGSGEDGRKNLKEGVSFKARLDCGKARDVDGSDRARTEEKT